MEETKLVWTRRISTAILAAWVSALAQPLTAQETTQSEPVQETTQSEPVTETPDGKVLLRLRLREGQTYATRMTAQTKTSQNMTESGAYPGLPDKPQRVDMNQNMSFGSDMRVLKVEADGTAQVRVTYHSIKMEMGLPGMPPFMSYDSAKPAKRNDVTSAMMSSMVGQSITLKLSPLGRVLQVSGMEAMTARMLSKMKLGSKEATQVRQTIGQLQKNPLFNGGAGFASSMAVFPDRALGIGDSWKAEVAAAAGSSPPLSAAYTLRSRRNGIASLGVQMTMKPQPLPTPAAVPGFTMSGQLTGTQSGTMQVDEATGWTRGGSIESRFTTRSTAKMKVGAQTQTMRSTGTIKGTVTFTSTAKPATSATPISKPTEKPKGTTMNDVTELVKEDLTFGIGAEAKAGDRVTVHYRGTLTNGTQFDASYDRGQSFTFTLGAGEVIKGWDEGVAGMKVGGKRRLTIPPAMGYGARGAGGVIPPNATLVFEVDLLKIN